MRILTKLSKYGKNGIIVKYLKTYEIILIIVYQII